MEKNTKNLIKLGGTLIGATVLGLYTQNVAWDPTIRAIAHFVGALGVPSYTSLITSLGIANYESFRDKKILKNKEKLKEDDKEKQPGFLKYIKQKHKNVQLSEEEKYHINPKLKKILMNSSMVVGSLGYMAFCASWESWQFAQSNVFQLPQYIADFSGPLIGMFAVGSVDFVPALNKINQIEDKIKSYFKVNRNIEDLSQEIQEPVNEQTKNEKENTTEKLPVWDLRLYEERKEENVNLIQEELSKTENMHARR